MNTQLMANSLFEYPKAGKEHEIERVLYIDPSTDLAITIFIYGEKAVPRKRRLSPLKRMLAEGKASLYTNDPYIELLDASTRPKKHFELRDEAWRILKTMVQLENGEPNIEIFDATARSRIVQEAVDKYHKSKTTLYHWLRKYWQRGQTMDAVFPDFIKCGARGKGRYTKDAKIKLGKPSAHTIKSGNVEGIPLTPTVKKYFRRVLDYFHKRGATLPDTYQELLDNYFSSGFAYKGDILYPVHFPIDQIPTFRQFENYFYNYWEEDIAEQQKKRHGERRYSQDFSPVLGDTRSMAMGPGHIAQFDSTILDAYLVSSLDRARIIGRPVLYVIEDVFSSLVTGMALMLQGPSWDAARFAFENMATDKVAFCKGYGITIVEEDWPGGNIPFELIGDRGESLGKNGENLPENLGITLSNTPPFFPRWKPLIERRFHTINSEAIKWLPSYVNKDYVRGDPDYRLDSCLTLYELRWILIQTFLFHNRFHELKNLRHDKLLITDHVEPYPIDIWNWGIENRTGQLRRMNPDLVRMSLLPKDVAYITERGIIFRGKQYDCLLAHEQNWYDRARARGRWHIDAHYEHHSANRIFIHPDNGGFIECQLHPNESVAANQDWYEILQKDYDFRAEQPIRDAKERQGRAILNAQIKSRVKPALAEAKEARKGMSKAAQTRDIRKNRAAEQQIEDKKTNPIVSSSNADQMGPSISGDHYIPPSKHTDKYEKIEKEFQDDNK